MATVIISLLLEIEGNPGSSIEKPMSEAAGVPMLGHYLEPVNLRIFQITASPP